MHESFFFVLTDYTIKHAKKAQIEIVIGGIMIKNQPKHVSRGFKGHCLFFKSYNAAIGNESLNNSSCMMTSSRDKGLMRNSV